MEQYKYKDWNYQFKNGKYEIKWSKDIKLPKSVYKYYSNSHNNFEAVFNQYLFCSHQYNLNDSMDGNTLLWDFSNMTKLVFKNFYGDLEHNYESDKKNGFRFFKQDLFDYLSNGSGIISLTTEPLQTLMWSHYASECGFMIELDWQEVKDNLEKLNPKLDNYVFLPIQYVNNLERVDFFSDSIKSPDLPYVISNSIKRINWEYEKEWRLIPFSKYYGIPNSIKGPYKNVEPENKRNLHYPKSAIKSITLGKQFFNGKNLEKVIGTPTGNGTIFKIKDAKIKYLEFIMFLIENFNDKIYYCGEYEDSKGFNRSAERIQFNKIDKETVELIRTGEKFQDK